MATSKEDIARLTLDLPTDLHRQIKVQAAVQGVTMRELLEACIRRCLATTTVPTAAEQARPE